ncbi:MAG: multiheme c-type cytochrome [Phycisphaerae bacterium]
MKPEILVVEEICLWAAVAAALWFLGRRREGRGLLVRGGVGVVIVLLGVVVAWKADAARRSRVNLAVLDSLPNLGMPDGRFVSSDACQSCHPEAFDSWQHSFHRSMTQRASAASVLGDFDGVNLKRKRNRYSLERRGDAFWVEMPDPDWERALVDRGINPDTRDDGPRGWQQVVMTTGSHHFQTYWVGSKQGRELHNLPFAWMVAENRWIPRDEAFLRPPGMQRSFARWNDNCVECHATGGAPDRHPENGIFDTRVAELGIACESCHGPGEEHIRANADPLRRYRFRIRDAADPTIVNPAKLSPRRATHVCGQCHGANVFRGKAFAQGLRYRPGDDLLETRLVLRGTDKNLVESERVDWRSQQYHVNNQDEDFMRNRFWPDGMIRIAGREHNAIVESACFRKGEMTCLSCHSMHDYTEPSDQLGDQMGDDEACLQCHQVYRSRLEEHTHHEAGSSGSRCYNCHMPHTVYGLMQNVRSHWIDSPSVATTVETGRPNACNLCHLDRTLAWTNEHLADWYEIRPAQLSKDQTRVAGSLLWLLTGHAHQRAMMAWHMGWGPAQEASGTDWMVPYLGHLLIDPYSAIRHIAARTLRSLPGAGLPKYSYLGSNKHLSGVRNEVVNGWLQRARPPDKPCPQLLIDTSGQLDLDEFIRLAKHRDPISLFLEE